MLRSAPGIEDRYLMHAGDGTVRSAGFLGHILAADVVDGVLLQWSSRIAALLRAVVHQAILTNVYIARAGTAAPLVGPALSDVVLKAVDTGEAALLHRLHLVIDALFFFCKRLQLAAAIVNNANRRTKTESQRPPPDGQRVLRIAHAPADHGIYVHVEISMFGEQFQLLIQNLEALLGNIV